MASQPEVVDVTGAGKNLFAAAAAAANPSTESKPVAAKREATISVRYESPSGDMMTATLTSRVLVHDEKLERARMAVIMAGPAMPYDRYPQATRNRLYALATLYVQLRPMPTWMESAVQDDDVLLFSVFEALQEHDDAFFRRRAATGAGETPKAILEVGTLVYPGDPQEHGPDEA